MKTKSKKVISLLLAIIMATSMLAGLNLTAFAATATSGTCGTNCKWSVSGTIMTIQPSDSSKDATMTDYAYNTTPWKSYISTLKKVVIKGRVTKVGDFAFDSFKTLTTVDLSQATSLTSIGKDAFSGTAITSLTIPSTVVTIGDNAFSNTSISSITIPSNVETIGISAFQYNNSLTTVDLSGATSLKTISKSAFSPTAIKSITIPSTVETIGDYAFYNCQSLITVDLSKATSLKTIGELAFSYTAITSITIPSNVETIGNSAFKTCTSLTTVDLSGTTSLKTIGSSAFENCTSLTTVDLSKSTLLETIGSGAFYACKALETVDLSNATSLKTIDEYAFGSTIITSIMIPSTVETIGGYAFSICQSLAKVVNYSKNTTFGSKVFNYCSSNLIVYGYAGSTTDTYCSDGTNFYGGKSHFKAFADYDAYDAALTDCKNKKAEDNYEKSYTQASREQFEEVVNKYWDFTNNQYKTDTIDTTDLFAEQNDVDNATTELTEALNLLVPIVDADITLNVNVDGELVSKDTKTYDIGSIYNANLSEYEGYTVTKWTVEDNETKETKKVNTEALDFYYTVDKSVTINAYLSSNKEATTGTTKVTYLSRTGAVLNIDYVTNGNAVDITSETAKAKAPTVSFYDFTSWKVVSGTPSNPDGNDIVLRAIYDINNDENNFVTVHCLGNVKANGQKDLKIFYDKAITLTGSNKDAKFAYVTDKGTVVSYIDGNVIFAPHCSEIYIAEVTEDSATTMITGAYTSHEGSVNKFAINCIKYVPADAQMVECGAIVTLNDSVGRTDKFVIGTDGVAKYTSLTQTKAGEYTMKFSGDFAGTDFETLYCRSYVTYTKDGKTFTVYSAVETLDIVKGE